jgi:hypothetical protein
MKYITGIGGVFFKANDPEKLGASGQRNRSLVTSVGRWDPEGNRIELWEPPLA